ncbi:putative WWE domain, poly(ADP-ribose) polymerase, catalytic domain, RST domain of plant [Lupinus albus]|uniref:Putative WWE domain, poly(ADP-ribose) polymerase, catalytic domain, RST domain of plant n=1 Tax=Lupinus albus TaxID=3870 RepID=A0A6A4QGR7_LUPAL|nr:putative WWE domain, poly(ADP-ribose) polymerase, catalytic domain, RST domain of plant [Lupinus albus]
METKSAKALDRNVLNVKRKRAIQYATYLNGASRSVLPYLSPFMSPKDKFVKQRRLGGSKSKLTKHGNLSLIRYYLNYKKTGRPERLMFYQNGEWMDFPKDVLDSVKKDLHVKKAAVEIELNGHHLVLDFLHMYQMDLKTGFQKPIAWIDEKGCCFFPEVVAVSDEEFHDFCKQEGEKCHYSLFQDPYKSNEIKLHLDIEINGEDNSKLRDCSGESNVLVKHIQVDTKEAVSQYDVEVEDSSTKKGYGNVGKTVEQNQNIVFNGSTEFLNRELELDTVKQLFLKGMSDFGSADIVDIYHCSSPMMQARLELFEKQALITKKCRGDSNVRYAWLASSKGESSTMVNYGLGHCGLFASKCTYGIGVHLAAASCPYASASYCDVDENGVQCLVLCRVIMGNMEVLRPGSRQFHPSSVGYDSGVDDIQSPTFCVVWNMNINTHIYPEFIVSFKVSSDSEGQLRGSVYRNNASEVNMTGQCPQGLLHSSPVDISLLNCGVPQGKATNVVNSMPKAPNSPWMSFPMLLAAIKDQIPPKDMEHVILHYQTFMAKKITLEDFGSKLRLIVGDNIIRDMVTRLRNKIPPKPVIGM